MNKMNWTSKKLAKVYLAFAGFAALLWFLLRVIPKPQRAGYPCQQVAFPMASAFIIWLSVNIFSFMGIKKLSAHYKLKGNFLTIILIVALSVFYVAWLGFAPIKEMFASTNVTNELFVPSDSANKPVGVERGIMPGRVAWAFDTTFSKWAMKGNWWDSAYTDQAIVSEMISKSIQTLANYDEDTVAWDKIFKYFNNRTGRGNIGYTKGEKIAIKLSLVQTSEPESSGGNSNFTPPQTVLALLRQLVYVAGVNEEDITFFDIMRSVPTSITMRCKQEFPKVHFVGSKTGTYQEKYVRDTTSIHWSKKLELEIKGGNTAYLPTIITEATYLINLANLKGHRYVGVTGCSKNHFGSMSANGDVNTPKAIGLHPYVAVHDYKIPTSAEWSFTGNVMGTYNALVDLMGHKDLGEKTLLFIIDGLFSTPRENDPNSVAIKWKQSPFNNHFSSSIFMSQDNVAIESVTIDFLREEQAINPSITQKFDDGTGYHNVIFGSIDNYLHEAALANNPPSGTKYSPNWEGKTLTSLGVHEHWNNATDKQYSRNLGKNYGIELIKISPDIEAPKNLVASITTDNKVKLSWENNTHEGYYQIFRSVNSTTNFKLIGDADIYTKTFTDKSAALNVTNYYRIKIKENVNFSNFSNETSISIPTNLTQDFVNYSLSVYPNPACEKLNVKLSHPSEGEVSISISDITGKVVRKLNVNKTENKLQQSIDLKGIRSGMYVVSVIVESTKYNKTIMVK